MKRTTIIILLLVLLILAAVLFTLDEWYIIDIMTLLGDFYPLLIIVVFILFVPPATISASCAFMMPVATPPNAIVFGSSRIKIAEMARVGIFLNIIGAIVVTAVFYLIGTSVFSIDIF